VSAAAPSPLRPLREAPDGGAVVVIDQRALPHRLAFETLATPEAVHHAIREMVVRGAPLIGATAAYGLALALRQDAGDAALDTRAAWLKAARPTAVNLAWALDRLVRHVRPLPAGALRPPGRWPAPSPRRTWTSTAASASTACRCCATSPRARAWARAGR
jgi:methylthioribose-1-phosphate isomerase